MSGPVVTQEDREAAWPFRPSCYRDIPLTRAKWEAGVYDDAAPCIKAFARHREQSTAPLEAQIAALQARCEALAGALGEAIVWDGYDEDGVPAVWLDQADAALSQPKGKNDD